MKIRVVGGPVEGKVEVEAAANANFATILVLIEGVVCKGPLHDKYNLHKCEIIDKKAKAVALLAPTDTPQSAELPATGAIVMLKAIAGSPVGTPRDASTAKTAASAPVKKLTFRDRMVALYELYDPSKVGTVDATLEKYKGKEEAVIKKLVEKYGPEPVAEDASKPSSLPAAELTSSSSSQRTPKERMIALYEKYDPAKLGTVDATLEKFKGKEEAVIKKLVEKYGPEPAVEASIPKAQPPPPPPSAPTPQPASTPTTPRESSVSYPAAGTSFRNRIVAMYNLYDPSKTSTVDATLEKYKGKEEAVIKKLVEKYGPEPTTAAVTVNDVAAAPEPERNRAASVAQQANLPDAERRHRGASVAVASHQDRDADASPTPAENVLPDSQDVARTSTGEAKSVALESSADTQPPKLLGSPESGGAAVTPHSVDKNQLLLQIEAMDARFASLVGALMRRALEDANHKTLRHRFQVWLQHTLEQKAEKLVSGGRWTVDAATGAYVCQVSNPPYVTPDLVSFLKTEGTARSQVFSDALSDVLRLVIQRSTAVTDPNDRPRIPVSFSDDDATVEFLHHAVTALESAATHLSELHSLRRTSAEEHAELTALRHAHKQATARLAVAEPEAAKASELTPQLAEAKRELELLRKRCQRQEDDVKHVNNELAKTLKELEMERRGLPTEMEVVIRQKDMRLAAVERELAKMRVKLRHFANVESEYLERIKELESDVVLLERSRSVVGVSRRIVCPGAQPSASPKFHSPILKQYAGSEGPSLTARTSTTPQRGSSVRDSQRRVPPIPTELIQYRLQQQTVLSDTSGEDLNFEPSPRPSSNRTPVISSPQTSRELRELALKSELLEHELAEGVAKRGVLAAAVVGDCPHCNTNLTALRSSSPSTFTTNKKHAFCFSCRRSFSLQELHEFSVARRQRSKQR